MRTKRYYIAVFILFLASFVIGTHLGYDRGVLMASDAVNRLEISQMKAIIEKNQSRDALDLLNAFLNSAERDRERIDKERNGFFQGVPLSIFEFRDRQEILPPITKEKLQ